jgi:hypothetical protein
MTDRPESVQAASVPAANRFDRMEWAGAFGDLGTLIPFVVAYIGVLNVDPHGVLFAFGVAGIVCGLVYRTPFPVQPMKAIGAVATTQAAQTIVLTSNAIYAAGSPGSSGSPGARVRSHWSAPVVTGIILGLGYFMLQVHDVRGLWFGGIGLAGTLLLLAYRAFPAMFALLALALSGDCRIEGVAGSRPYQQLRAEFRAGLLTWNDLMVGCLSHFPAATYARQRRDRHHRREPPVSDRPVSERRSASRPPDERLGSTVGGGRCVTVQAVWPDT